jgi:hypothetical protein
MSMQEALAAAKAAYDIEAQCIEEMKAYFDDEQFAKAVDTLKETDGYLFAPVAPAFAAGTGTSAPQAQPATLAGALRERFAGSAR